MFSMEQSATNTLALYHDLSIEVGRVELAMDALNLPFSEDDTLRKQRLESRLVKLQDAIHRLQA